MKQFLLVFILIGSFIYPFQQIAAQGLLDPERPVYQEENSQGANYMKNRKALVGRYCVVNKLINVVGVGSWIQDLNNLTDEDLDNVATFPKVVAAGVTANPIVSVRDMSSYYHAGTQAGFCIVASSGTSVLSLDVIKALSIALYRDGVLQETIAVKEGQDASGVGLSLIKLPGSDDASVNLTVNSTKTFDEVCLVDAGGVNLAVGNVIKIKYAFVGKASENYLTYTGMTQYGTKVNRNGIYLKGAQGWNPVLLGIPFPLLDSEVAKLTNDNLADYAALTPIIAAGYQGGVKLIAAPAGDAADQSEVFKSGSELGFKYINASALNLDVGSWIRIILFDKAGNKVQEETVSAGVVNLGVASGGQGTSSIIAKTDFSGAEIRFHTVLSVNVGALGVYYGFVREKPDVPHSCDINPSVNTNICEEQTSFQLESNPELTVTWTSVSQPVGANAKVSNGGYVTGMDKIGEYIFRATAADGCYQEVTLTHGDFASESICGEPLVNMDGSTQVKYELSTSIYGSSGGLISISDLANPSNILNTDYMDYASYTSGLGLADNLRIIGVKTKDGTLIYDGSSSDAKKTRIGFVVEFETTGLDLSLLQFFQIRTYKGGVETYRHVIEETDVLSVGLAGSNRNQKVRFSINIDPIDKNGNPIQLDEFMLWKSGVLDLTVSTLRIYYPFIEDSSSTCNDPLGCGTTILSAQETGTSINSNETRMTSVVQVAGVADNLSFLIDNDLNTAMTIVNSVTVGGGTVIAVNMGRTLDYRHQLGLVVDNKTYTLGAKVGGWLTVTTYNKGVETGDKFTDWNVLGVNAIGYGDKNFLLMQPKKKYDEVRITVAGIVGALDIQSFYGFFLRGDIDNDGIPDCQDPESCFTNIKDIVVNSICVGDQITISGTGMTSTNYTISLPEQGINESFTTDQDGSFKKMYTLNIAGRFNMMFLDGSGNLVTTASYAVHPNVTTWKKQPVNTDWNEWTNWTNGSPYCCTDVIIPSDAAMYPLLSETVADGDEYCCNYIHFESRAAIEKIPKLNYVKAWVEMELTPNRYYMLTAPLKSMYTGDMFIPAAMNGVQTGNYFTQLTGDNTPQNRFNPRIYQRLWQNEAPGKLMNGNGIALGITETQWSKNFNHLSYAYQLGKGFSLWVDNGILSSTQMFRFRFPKEHTLYNYYNDYDGTQLSLTETLARDNSGRFIYEGNSSQNISFDYEGVNRTVYEGVLPLTITLSAPKATKYFLIGNPFMSHIDVAAFMKGNSGIAAVKVYDGNTNNTVVAVDGQLLSNANGLTAIAPMQSFFVVNASEVQNINVTFTEEMLNSISPVPLRSKSDKAVLRVNIENGSGMASTLILEDDLQTDLKPGTESLFDNEVKPSIALFSLSEGKAYDILDSQSQDKISLGMYLEKTDTVIFRFKASESFDVERYVLKDNETGMCFPLQNEIMFPNLNTNINRFALIDATDQELIQTRDLYISVEDNKASIISNTLDISAVAVYDMSGKMNYNQTLQGVNEINVPIGKGVQIIRVILLDGSVRSFKILG